MAAEIGLDSDEMQQSVEARRYRGRVNAIVQEAHQIGVSGVPTSVLNERFAIVGAQPYAVFLQTLERLR